MKLTKKIIAIILLINIVLIANISNATSITSANLYSKGDCGDLLKYNGALLYSTFVVYNNNGKEYPAYCIQKELDGVREHGPYTVSIDSLLSNVAVWRTIINGYPYKTPEQLGCATKEEAYTATKQAIYCTIYGNNLNNYEAVGEAGKRTLSALKKILSAANSSTETKLNADLKITSADNEWKIDKINSKYVSKTFYINSEAPVNKYTVTLQGNIPEEVIITDEKNNIKKEFTGSSKFKILLPITNLNQNGNFVVNVTSSVNTKPVFYGKSPVSNLQDYAVTTGAYEDTTGKVTLEYNKNLTKINILKQEEETKEPLEGVKFELLDNNKNKVFTDLVTDSNGKIVLNNMLPGKYYLKEVSTKEGFVIYKDLIEVNLQLNESTTITVNNSKYESTKIENSEEFITVNNKGSEITVSNTVEFSDISKNEEKTNINNSTSNTIKNESIENTNTNNQNNNKNENLDEQNININNENNNSNKNENINNTNINNKNNNENINLNKNNTNINNENNNANVNENANNTNLNNKNDNENTNLNENNNNINSENNNANVNENLNNTDLDNKNNNTNINSNIQNNNVNNQNSNININENINNTNINNQNDNQNNNFNAQFVGVKLPKTGM